MLLLQTSVQAGFEQIIIRKRDIVLEFAGLQIREFRD
jgi:hypothetical protein